MLSLLRHRSIDYCVVEFAVFSVANAVSDCFYGNLNPIYFRERAHFFLKLIIYGYYQLAYQITTSRLAAFARASVAFAFGLGVL